MGRTACTEPQWLYKGALYLFLPLTASTLSPFQCTKHSNQNVVWGVGARCYCHWSGTTIQTKRSFLRHTQRNVAFHPRVPKCHVEELIDLRSIFSRRTTKTDGGQKSKRSINCAERELCLERILWRERETERERERGKKGNQNWGKKTVQNFQPICETVSFVYSSQRAKANITINPSRCFNP